MDDLGEFLLTFTIYLFKFYLRFPLRPYYARCKQIEFYWVQ